MENSTMIKKTKAPMNKAVKILLLGIIVILAAAIVLYVSFLFYRDYLAAMEFPQKKEILTPAQPNGKKTLVIYQPSSHSGFTEQTAYNIAKGMTEKGAEVTIMRPVKDSSVDIGSFNTIVFGSPWYSQPSRQLLEFMNNTSGYSKAKIHMFLTAGGQNAPFMFDKMESCLKGAGSIASKTIFASKDPKVSAQEALNLGRKIGEDE